MIFIFFFYFSHTDLMNINDLLNTPEPSNGPGGSQPGGGSQPPGGEPPRGPLPPHNPQTTEASSSHGNNEDERSTQENTEKQYSSMELANENTFENIQTQNEKRNFMNQKLFYVKNLKNARDFGISKVRKGFNKHELNFIGDTIRARDPVFFDSHISMRNSRISSKSSVYNFNPGGKAPIKINDELLNLFR